MTTRQQKAWSFIQRYHAQNDRIPTSRAIQEHLKCKSQTSGMMYLRLFEKKGLLEKAGSGWRFSRHSPVR